MSRTYSGVPPPGLSSAVPPEFIPSAPMKQSALLLGAEQLFLQHITHICSVSFSHGGVSFVRPSNPGGMEENRWWTFLDQILFPSYSVLWCFLNEILLRRDLATRNSLFTHRARRRCDVYLAVSDAALRQTELAARTLHNLWQLGGPCLLWISICAIQQHIKQHMVK